MRFLLNDIPDQANKAKYFLEKIESGVEKAYLTDLILSECIWVLEKFYKIPKKEIISKIKSLILFDTDFDKISEVKRKIP